MDNPVPVTQDLLPVKSWHDFESQFPLLAMACKVVDWDGDPDRDSLWEACVRTALCRRFSDAESELQQLSAPDYLSVVHADPGEELECAPIACRVLTGIFA